MTPRQYATVATNAAIDFQGKITLAMEKLDRATQALPKELKSIVDERIRASMIIEKQIDLAVEQTRKETLEEMAKAFKECFDLAARDAKNGSPPKYEDLGQSMESFIANKLRDLKNGVWLRDVAQKESV